MRRTNSYGASPYRVTAYKVRPDNRGVGRWFRYMTEYSRLVDAREAYATKVAGGKFVRVELTGLEGRLVDAWGDDLVEDLWTLGRG